MKVQELIEVLNDLVKTQPSISEAPVLCQYTTFDESGKAVREQTDVSTIAYRNEPRHKVVLQVN